MIREEVMQHLKPGVRSEQVYEAAVALAKKLGYGDSFMNYGKAQVAYVGHGVGLELDEYPFLARGFDMPLETGMTVAVEPKVALGHGVVGIEDTFLITEADPEPLTFTDRRLCII
jgi:Xaa-Pro aminopeptidase